MIDEFGKRGENTNGADTKQEPHGVVKDKNLKLGMNGMWDVTMDEFVVKGEKRNGGMKEMDIVVKQTSKLEVDVLDDGIEEFSFV